jgi:hypothetical protein
MNLSSGILKHSIQNSKDEDFHFYNSLVLTDDLVFQRTHFRKIPQNIPHLYQHDTVSDSHEDLPLQNRSNDQNNELLKIAILIAILIATNARTTEILQAILDYRASCCVTSYIDDFIHQPTPIRKTTLKGIAGGLRTLGRGAIQLIMKQESQETTTIIIIIENVIHAPDCPIRLIGPQQLYHQSKAKAHERACSTTDKNKAIIFHGGDQYTCDYHPKTKIPTLSCVAHLTNKISQTTATTNFAPQPSFKGRKWFTVNAINNTTEPITYLTNRNTAQQVLLCLHETHAHTDMKEIQQKIKNCDIKATRQVVS